MHGSPHLGQESVLFLSLDEEEDFPAGDPVAVVVVEDPLASDERLLELPLLLAVVLSDPVVVVLLLPFPSLLLLLLLSEPPSSFPAALWFMAAT